MHFLGAMRIKNEARWIARVIESQLGLVERIYIFDDHSTDETVEICRSYPEVTLIESPFDTLDESRDKQLLLDRILSELPWADINKDSPWWVLAIDGDEVLDREAPAILREVVELPDAKCFSLRILYLWNQEDQIRVDGVYGHFYRPSLFRLINEKFKYITTPFGNGANLHCSSIPQEYLGHAVQCPAALLHLGYMHREDRIRKFQWYNRIDPRNAGEDGYRHMVIGDMYPEWMRGKHGGPLELIPLEKWRARR